MSPLPAEANVARTILEQLGGHGFSVMVGARDFVYYPNAIKFRLPVRFAKDGINCCHIQLEISDTYTVAFYRIGRAPSFKVEKRAEHHDVYADNLRDVFRSATGLETRMPTITRVER